MGGDVTKRLGPKQVKALGLLLEGRRQREAAAAVGVSEATVSRWVNHDAEFMAALNRAKLDAWEAQRARLAGLSEKAVDALAALLTAGSEAAQYKAACTVLDAAGLLARGRPVGDTDAATIERKRRQREQIGSVLGAMVGGDG